MYAQNPIFSIMISCTLAWDLAGNSADTPGKKTSSGFLFLKLLQNHPERESKNILADNQ